MAVVSKKFYSYIISLVLFCLVSTFCFADGLQPEHLFKMKNVNEVTVSDDGRFIAYTLIVPYSINDGIGRRHSELHVLDTKNDEHIDLITGLVNISQISWLPGSNYIYFRKSGTGTTGHQIFKINIESRQMIQVTDFDRSVAKFQIKNDNEIYFTAREPLSSQKETLIDADIYINIFEEEIRQIELFKYIVRNQEVIPLIEGATVYDFTLSPDGRSIAAAVSEKNLVDYYYMFQRIHIVSSQNGRLINKMDNPGKLGMMKWSPNGRRLAFLASSDIDDSVVGSIFVMNANNTNQRFKDLKNLVEGLELSAIYIDWKDNNTIYYAAEESVDIGLSSISLSDYRRETVLEGGQIVYRNFELNNNKIYFAANTKTHPNELFKLNLENNKLNKLTSHNSWLENVNLAKQEKIKYKARDGKEIHGVLVYPLNYEEGKTYPLIVYIHGGPEACVKNGWSSRYATWGQFAAARDYFVFSPNYRASSGRGVDFTMAGFGDLLGTEYDDVIDGIDHLINTGKVDKNKVGIGGGSYGGFFAAYSATKHTDRFAASVVFVGIANQVSKRKTTDIPYEDYYVHWGFWTHEDHDKVWNASPVKYAHKSKTPTLILHGEQDTRIPPSQGLELYRALKLHSDAPTRLVLYPEEGHGNSININQYDYLLRTLEWFDYYMIDNPGSNNLPDKYIDYNIN